MVPVEVTAEKKLFTQFNWKIKLLLFLYISNVNRIVFKSKQKSTWDCWHLYRVYPQMEQVLGPTKMLSVLLFCVRWTFLPHICGCLFAVPQFYQHLLYAADWTRDVKQSQCIFLLWILAKTTSWEQIWRSNQHYANTGGLLEDTRGLLEEHKRAARGTKKGC